MARTTPPLPPKLSTLVCNRLTPRQLEVLALIGAGCSDSEIADRLVRSIKTVGAHIRAIRQRAKEGLPTESASRAGRRVVLARLAIDACLPLPPDPS